MSYFYGELHGARQPKTATAHKNTGLRTLARSFSGDIETVMLYREKDDKIEYRVVLRDHDSGATIKELAFGELEGRG